MSTRFGVVVVGDDAAAGTATVHVSLEDAGMADAASTRIAEVELPEVPIRAGTEIPFEIDVDEVPPGAIVRVHVDYSGDRSLAPGDQYSTISIPADVLGRAADDAGRIPVRRI